MDSYQNIKVTTPEDLVVAEAFLHQSGSFTGTVRRAASEVCDFIKSAKSEKRKD